MKCFILRCIFFEATSLFLRGKKKLNICGGKKKSLGQEAKEVPFHSHGFPVETRSSVMRPVFLQTELSVRLEAWKPCG